MLRSILELNDVAVSEIMTHRRNVVLLDADVPPATLLDEVLNSRFTRLPVWQGEIDNIVGVVHAKALLREVRAKGGDVDRINVLDVASKPWFIPDTTTLFDQLQAFRQRREHFALVVDEYGSLMGVVTLEDILEEIVGDIADEHDVAVAGVRAEPGGTYVVDGAVRTKTPPPSQGWSCTKRGESRRSGKSSHFMIFDSKSWAGRGTKSRPSD